jgi:RNA polymerase sigma factor (sigma-70 family)
LYITIAFLNTTAKYTEQELVEGLKLRREDAFNYLYDNYSAAIYGVINRIVESKDTANDILQEVFVKFWEHLDKYEASKGRLFTWLVNVARNYTIDIVRSKGYRKQQLIRGDENAVSNVEDSAVRIDRFDSMGLAKRVKQLDVNQQKVIHLAYFSGYTHEEIANELGIPLGTVKSRIRAAITELRKIVNIN